MASTQQFWSILFVWSTGTTTGNKALASCGRRSQSPPYCARPCLGTCNKQILTLARVNGAKRRHSVALQESRLPHPKNYKPLLKLNAATWSEEAVVVWATPVWEEGGNRSR